MSTTFPADLSSTHEVFSPIVFQFIDFSIKNEDTTFPAELRNDFLSIKELGRYVVLSASPLHCCLTLDGMVIV